MARRTILLVEDNAGDQRLTAEALRTGERLADLMVCRDGVEALEILKRRGEHANAPRPSLIIMDLNLPRKDGREVLAEIKEDPELKRIPVVVLTTSKSLDDVTKSYEQHANCFIVKPVEWEQFVKTLHAVERFWLSIVELP